jgi:hypothetical protein
MPGTDIDYPDRGFQSFPEPLHATTGTLPEIRLPPTYFFNGSTALVGPGRYFGFLIYLRAVGLFGRVISSSQGLYLNTRQHKHRINTYTHH